MHTFNSPHHPQSSGPEPRSQGFPFVVRFDTSRRKCSSAARDFPSAKVSPTAKMAGSKTWSLRYLAARLMAGVDETLKTLNQLGSGTATLPAALAKGIERASRKNLTSVVYFAGAAMLPTLNPQRPGSTDGVERLLMRVLPRPSQRSVFVGDVVAFTSPWDTAGSQVGRCVFVLSQLALSTLSRSRVTCPSQRCRA